MPKSFVLVSLYFFCAGNAHAQDSTSGPAADPQEDRIRSLEEKVRNLERAASGQEKQQKEAKTDLRLFWKEGLRFETADRAFSFKFGGRIMNDWAWISEDRDVRAAIGDQEDGTEFRRARLYLEGTIYTNISFKAEYDFEGGDADFRDVWIGMRDAPVVGNVKVGHFKEPFGLEELTSSNHITFLERSLPIAFAPGRNTGFSLYGTALEERITWSVGAFRDTDDFGNRTVEGDSAATVRITALPWYAEEGAKLFHLGVAASLRAPNNETLRYRERPEVRLADRFVDTGSFVADRVRLLGLEAAVVYGAFSLQGEYILSEVDSTPAGDPSFSGYYVQASLFLTGEHRRYKKSAAVFDRVRPKKNFPDDGGSGAWELALRRSHIDLEDSPISGGQLSNNTIAVNWYLNPNVRIMLNGVFADLKGVGDAEAVMARFQIDF